MSGFIHNLFNRHLAPSNTVMPRLKGRFESSEKTFGNPDPGISIDHEIHAATFSEPSLAPSVIAQRNVGDSRILPVEVEPVSVKRTSIPVSQILNSPENQVKDEDDLQTTESHLIYKTQPNDHALKSIAPLDENRFDKHNSGNILPLIEKGEKLNQPELPMQSRKGSSSEDFSERNKPNEKRNSDLLSETSSLLTSGKFITVKKEIIQSFVKPTGILGEPPGANGYSKQIQETVSEHPAVPVIKVSIGQITIKAISPTSAVSRKPITVPKPALSLDEYLKKRSKDHS